MSILLKNGTVIDYASNTEEKLDILIEGNKITKISEVIESGTQIGSECRFSMIRKA